MSGKNAFGLAEIFDFFSWSIRRKVQTFTFSPVDSEPISRTLSCILLFPKTNCDTPNIGYLRNAAAKKILPENDAFTEIFENSGHNSIQEVHVDMPHT